VVPRWLTVKEVLLNSAVGEEGLQGIYHRGMKVVSRRRGKGEGAGGDRSEDFITKVPERHLGVEEKGAVNKADQRDYRSTPEAVIREIERYYGIKGEECAPEGATTPSLGMWRAICCGACLMGLREIGER